MVAPTLLRTKDLEAQGLSRVAIRRLAARGELVQVGRGLYTSRRHRPSQHHALAAVTSRAPAAIVCLLSALAFHGLTTQQPNEVWITLPARAWRPTLDWPSVRVVRASGPRLEAAVEHHRIEGVDVAIYGIAKTIVDCFRHRRDVGTEVFLEALREGLRRRRTTRAELAELAGRLGVGAMLRPYLEAV